jgi:hypothetical protein
MSQQLPPSKLQVESLEATLKQVTFDMKHLKMWPNMSRCSCPKFFSVGGDLGKDVLARRGLFRLLHKLMHESVYE